MTFEHHLGGGKWLQCIPYGETFKILPSTRASTIRTGSFLQYPHHPFEKKNGFGWGRTKMYLCHSEIFMSKDTESLGNNKRQKCIGGVHFDTPSFFILKFSMARFGPSTMSMCSACGTLAARHCISPAITKRTVVDNDVPDVELEVIDSAVYFGVGRKNTASWLYADGIMCNTHFFDKLHHLA